MSSQYHSYCLCWCTNKHCRNRLERIRLGNKGLQKREYSSCISRQASSPGDIAWRLPQSFQIVSSGTVSCGPSEHPSAPAWPQLDRVSDAVASSRTVKQSRPQFPTGGGSSVGIRSD